MASPELSEQLRWKTNMIANESQGAGYKNFIFYEHHAGARNSFYHLNLKFYFFGLHTAYVYGIFLFTSLKLLIKVNNKKYKNTD